MCNWIYYDTETCSSSDVAAARSITTKPFQELMPAVCVWPAELNACQATRFLDYRDSGYLDQLFPWIEQFSATVEAELGSLAFCRNLSLADISLYELMYAMAPRDQQLRVLLHLREHGAKRVIWVGHRSTSIPSEAEIKYVSGASEVKICRLGNPAKRLLGCANNRARYSARLIFERAQEWGTRLRPTLSPFGDFPSDSVAFADFYPNSVKTALPIAKRLKQEGHEVLWLAGRDSVATVLNQAGISFIHLTPIMRSMAQEIRQRSRVLVRALARVIPKIPNAAFAGSASQPCRGFLANSVLRETTSKWCNALAWATVFDRVATHVRPALLCTTTFSSAFGRAAALAMRREGRRSVYIQHGIIPANAVYTNFAHELLLVWGEYDRRNIQLHSRRENQVVVTGSSIIDARSTMATAKARTSSGRFQVAFLPTLPGGAFLTIEAARTAAAVGASAVSSMGNADLVVKLHPGDRTGVIEKVVKGYGPYQVTRNLDLGETIRGADVVILSASTVGLHACAAGRPLIVLQENLLNDTVPYVAYGAALGVSLFASNPEAELLSAFQRIRDDPVLKESLSVARRLLVDDMLGGTDRDPVGESCRAIVNALAGCNDIQPPVC